MCDNESEVEMEMGNYFSSDLAEQEARAKIMVSKKLNKDVFIKPR